MSRDCREQKNSYEKKNEKAKKAVNRDDDELVLCSLTSQNKKSKKESLVCGEC